jgi:hypothetical protein
MLVYSHRYVRLSAHIAFGSPLISIQGDHVFSGISRPLSIYYVRPFLAFRDAFRDVIDIDISDQRRQPQGMRVQRSGQDMLVTITKTIEFDVDFRLGRGRGVDEENEDYTPGLGKEEQQIQTLELQMKQDLEI